jgi:hypothetical protein
LSDDSNQSYIGIVPDAVDAGAVIIEVNVFTQIVGEAVKGKTPPPPVIMFSINVIEDVTEHSPALVTITSMLFPVTPRVIQAGIIVGVNIPVVVLVTTPPLTLKVYMLPGRGEIA